MIGTNLKKVLLASAALVALCGFTASADAGWWWGAGPSCCGYGVGYGYSCGYGGGCHHGCGWGGCHDWGWGWDGCNSCCSTCYTPCYSTCYSGCSSCYSGCSSCYSSYSSCGCGGTVWGSGDSCGCGGSVISSTPSSPSPAVAPSMPAGSAEPAKAAAPDKSSAPAAPALGAPAAPANPAPGLGIPNTGPGTGTTPAVPPLGPPTIGPSSSMIEGTSEDGCLLTVWVPQDAKVTINGLATKSTGSRRTFASYGLKSGFTYKYEVKAEVVRLGKVVTDSKTVSLTAGGREGVAFGFNIPQATETASNE